MSNDDSVTQWLMDLKQGDEQAAQSLWDRYFQRLHGLARKRLRGIARLPTDGEDVALSAFKSLCAGAEAGRFADLGDRDSLWKLLVTITVRKARRTVRDEFRLKRGGGQTVGESVFMTHEEAAAGVHGFEQVLGREPTPELAAMVAEESQRLLAALGDDELRKIAVWRMEGLTTQEISVQLGKALATVERRLKLIRTIWTAMDEKAVERADA